MTKQNLPVPEGLVARFEHLRRVVIAADAHLPGGPAPVYTEPLFMNSHEWALARKEGFEVHVLPEGGTTHCRLYRPSSKPDEPDELIAIGFARCSLDDHYVKALGRIKALGAANAVWAKSQEAASA